MIYKKQIFVSFLVVIVCMLTVNFAQYSSVNSK